MFRKMFVVVGLVLLSLVSAACAPDAFGPAVGRVIPNEGEPCLVGDGSPDEIRPVPCGRCRNNALMCIGRVWACVSQPVERCIPLSTFLDAGSDASSDVIVDSDAAAVIADAADGTADAARDVNRDVSTVSSDASDGSSRDASSDANDGSMQPGNPCINDTGVCARTGRWNVVGLGLVCVSDTPGAPMPEVCDSLDNDCNGMIDEGCVCSPGVQRSCYHGSATTQGVGRCRNGYQVCLPGGMSRGDCIGEVLPSPFEVCRNQVDDNCNGRLDEIPCVVP